MPPKNIPIPINPFTHVRAGLNQYPRDLACMQWKLYSMYVPFHRADKLYANTWVHIFSEGGEEGGGRRKECACQHHLTRAPPPVQLTLVLRAAGLLVREEKLSKVVGTLAVAHSGELHSLL